MLGWLKKYRAQKAHAKAMKAEYMRQRDANIGNVHFYNWWPVDDYTTLWLYQFVQNTGLLKDSKKQINFCSMFDERDVLKHVKDGVKVFFSGENVHLKQWMPYVDGLLGEKDCRLSIGFEKYEDKRYMRFPLWLTYVFEPTLDEKKIRERCELLRHPETGDRDKFACLIARADISGIRTAMFEGLSEVGKVDCPSGLFHNDDSLVKEFGDDKVAYLHQYAFNICPENSNAEGYCTEKVFEAIAAGCVPIYWGCNNVPEQMILNQDAIIFWDKESNGAKAIEQIKKLSADKKQLETFMKQSRLIEGAEEEVLRMMNELYGRLKDLVS